MAEDTRRELDPEAIRYVQSLSPDAKFVWLSEEIKFVGKTAELAHKRINIIEQDIDCIEHTCDKRWWHKPAIIALALGNIGVASWIVYMFTQHVLKG